MKAHRSLAIRILSIFICLIILFSDGLAQTNSRALLNYLQGEWYMTGMVLGKVVNYTSEGEWVLRDQFFYFHMKDAAVPQTYEADLFIGIDSSKNQYVAHWLDSFGGAGARVFGLGPLSSEKIEIIYPYAEQNFRNLFTYDSTKDEWALVIESENKNGNWSLFARFKIDRKR